MIRAFLIALALSALSLCVHAQTPGTLNLTGPSTTPGAPQLTPQALNDAINAQLGLKFDATGLPAALAAPPCIGCTTPNAGAFSTLTVSSNVGVNGALVPGFHVNNLTNTSFGATAYLPFNGQVLNTNNTAFGYLALNAVTNQQNNTAIGTNALAVLSSTGASETAVGSQALPRDINGSFNTAIGNATLRYFTGPAIGNVAVGHGALAGDDTTPVANNGADNTAIGGWTGQEITTGNLNTFIGTFAGVEVQTGSENTNVGVYSGAGCLGCVNNIPGIVNPSFTTSVGTHSLEANQSNNLVAVGWSALKLSTTGVNETAVGFNTLTNSISDTGNTAVGNAVMATLNGGGGNTALGNRAMALATTGSNNVVVGSQAGSILTTGSSNILIGPAVATGTLTTGTNNILIGTSALVDTVGAGDSFTMSIGNVITASGMGTPATSATAVAGSLAVAGGMFAAGLPTSAPGAHCSLWVNTGVITRTTCP